MPALIHHGTGPCRRHGKAACSLRQEGEAAGDHRSSLLFPTLFQNVEASRHPPHSNDPAFLGQRASVVLCMQLSSPPILSNICRALRRTGRGHPRARPRQKDTMHQYSLAVQGTPCRVPLHFIGILSHTVEATPARSRRRNHESQCAALVAHAGAVRFRMAR